MSMHEVIETTSAGIGHNMPPTPIDHARDVYTRLSRFIRETPVIEDEETARKANDHLTIARDCIKEIERADKEETAPLYQAWKDVKEKYKKPLESLGRLVDQIRAPLADFMRAEELRRVREAEEARRAAEEAEARARAAEEAEREAIENANMGEIGVDIGAAIQDAEAAFSDFKEQSRAATIAEREAPVRFKSRFAQKATSLRTVETLVLEDAAKAIAAMGVTDKIRDAIISEARAYRKANGQLPEGVISVKDRTI